MWLWLIFRLCSTTRHFNLTHEYARTINQSTRKNREDGRTNICCMLQAKSLIRVEKKNAQRKRTTNSVEWIMLRHRRARALLVSDKTRMCLLSDLHFYKMANRIWWDFSFALTLSSLHFFCYNKYIFLGLFYCNNIDRSTIYTRPTRVILLIFSIHVPMRCLLGDAQSIHERDNSHLGYV